MIHPAGDIHWSSPEEKVFCTVIDVMSHYMINHCCQPSCICMCFFFQIGRWFRTKSSRYFQLCLKQTPFRRSWTSIDRLTSFSWLCLDKFLDRLPHRAMLQSNVHQIQFYTVWSFFHALIWLQVFPLSSVFDHLKSLRLVKDIEADIVIRKWSSSSVTTFFKTLFQLFEFIFFLFHYKSFLIRFAG